MRTSSININYFYINKGRNKIFEIFHLITKYK